MSSSKHKKLCTSKDQLAKDSSSTASTSRSSRTSKKAEQPLEPPPATPKVEDSNLPVFNNSPDIFTPTGKRIPKLAVVIQEWRAVASWKWKDASEDDCGICRSPFSACCNDCKYPGEECPIAVGKCSHTFHIHCIQKWLQSQQQQRQTCPMCRQEWNPTKTSGAADINNLD
ncbi:putative Anaphase-promoting complex subunit 11 [Hypsibius exemplaris]|uniref:Anaphase-promoting complex subunit 11 n=1 Tax=Hypsibius exemplaris TaxID=2072580 RepID=A0A9X6NDQ2_HYPEX|nr:putative Anaphase-promoting complex subunit 11 [Hypsibius exemplaris]